MDPDHRIGYRCETPADECRSPQDCGGAPCRFVGDHRVCGSDPCPV
jgi:hypothetical protein